MHPLRAPSPRVVAVDVATAAAFTGVVVLELGLHWDDGYAAGSLALNLPLFLLITLPVAFRRIAPLTALTVAFGSVAISSLFVAHTLFFFGGLVPLTLLVYSRPDTPTGTPGCWLLVAAPASLLATYPLHIPAFDLSDYAFGVVLFGAGGLAGRLVRRLDRQRRVLADALAAQEREQAARERALLLDERARIARELHDVVAHAVSVMVVQAGAARFALGVDEAEVRDRLLSVEETGRGAVGDLRRLLDLLRADDEDDATDDAAGSDRPQQGLDRLGDLVDGMQRAGLPVRLDVEGLPVQLPAAVDVTAYRVLQEALTNALKHSAGEWVHVAIRVSGDAVVLEVADPGPPRRTGAALSTGHGLVGMRERVALFGGRLEAGPADGGWRVRAELPRTPAVVEAAR